MADPKNNSDEPSIEEILSSIREIISDEDEEVKDFEEPKKAEPLIAQEDEDDVLDLSQFAEDDDTPEMVIDNEENNFDEIDFVDTQDEDEQVIDEEDQDDIEFYEAREDFPVEPQMDEIDNGKDHLIDKVAEGATVSAMARLAENISMSRKSDNITLEDIVRDLLRPMLKDWLDDNLPDIIERLVSQELERLAQKAARK